jgi:hypothetical protein
MKLLFMDSLPFPNLVTTNPASNQYRLPILEPDTSVIPAALKRTFSYFRSAISPFPISACLDETISGRELNPG